MTKKGDNCDFENIVLTQISVVSQVKTHYLLLFFPQRASISVSTHTIAKILKDSKGETNNTIYIYQKNNTVFTIRKDELTKHFAKYNSLGNVAHLPLNWDMNCSAQEGHFLNYYCGNTLCGASENQLRSDIMSHSIERCIKRRMLHLLAILCWYSRVPSVQKVL